MKILCKISIFAGALCIAGALALTLLYGLTVGCVIALVAGATLLCIGLFYEKLPRWARRTIVWGGAALVVALLTIITLAAVKGSRDGTTGREDYAIVLGCGVRGRQVLPTLARRLDRALEYALGNPSATIVVSGGQGPREEISEAEAMKSYLVARGVSPARVIEERRSRNTVQNIEFSKAILDSLSAGRPYTVACVTSRYHVMRAHQIARQAGLDVHMAGASVPWYLYPSGYLRESLSIVKYWLERE